MKEELGKSLTIAAIVLMVNSFGMVVGNLLGGSLFDKLGGYRTIMIGTVTCLISTTLLNFFHGWPWYAVWLVLLGFGGGMIVPAIYAMAGAVWPNGGRTTFNAIYLAQNIGVATGAAMGGFVAELSFNYIFLANLIMYDLFGIVAITQFNLEYHAKIRTPDSLDIHSKENKTFHCTLTTVCNVCYLLDCLHSMGNYNCIIHSRIKYFYVAIQYIMDSEWYYDFSCSTVNKTSNYFIKR